MATGTSCQRGPVQGPGRPIEIPPAFPPRPLRAIVFGTKAMRGRKEPAAAGCICWWPKEGCEALRSAPSQMLRFDGHSGELSTPIDFPPPIMLDEVK